MKVQDTKSTESQDLNPEPAEETISDTHNNNDKPSNDSINKQFDKPIEGLNKISKKNLAIGAFILISVVFGFIFGIFGVRWIIGLALIYVIPLYFSLSYFKLEPIEKIFLALFSSFGIIPMSVYYLSKLFGSLRLSLVVAFVILMVIALVLNKDKVKIIYQKLSLFIIHKDHTQEPKK